MKKKFKLFSAMAAILFVCNCAPAFTAPPNQVGNGNSAYRSEDIPKPDFSLIGDVFSYAQKFWYESYCEAIEVAKQYSSQIKDEFGFETCYDIEYVPEKSKYCTIVSVYTPDYDPRSFEQINAIRVNGPLEAFQICKKSQDNGYGANVIEYYGEGYFVCIYGPRFNKENWDQIAEIEKENEYAANKCGARYLQNGYAVGIEPKNSCEERSFYVVRAYVRR